MEKNVTENVTVLSEAEGSRVNYYIVGMMLQICVIESADPHGPGYDAIMTKAFAKYNENARQLIKRGIPLGLYKRYDTGEEY